MTNDKTTMSIARALTVRLRRHAGAASQSTSDLPADATKRIASAFDRSKISSPVELISSTNMLSYDAPDVAVIRQQRQASNTISTPSSDDDEASSSADDSDHSSTHDVGTSSSTDVEEEDLTDASSVEASSPSSSEPEHNHLSCYFEAAQHESALTAHKRTSRSSNFLRRSASSSRIPPPSISRARSPDPGAPAIPHRAMSHSKSSHLALARKRSLQSLSGSGLRSGTHSAALSRSSSHRDLRASTYSVSSIASPAMTPADSSVTTTTATGPGASNKKTVSGTFLHPFGRELEKLSEVVEELSGVMRDAEDDDDAEAMVAHGLSRWTADEYLDELAPLYTVGFGNSGMNHPAVGIPAWI